MTDVQICQRYLEIASGARRRGIEFNLPLMSLMNIYKAKRCHITGVPLNKRNRSVDRLDNRLGYIKGNVVCVSKAVNQIKGYIENPVDTLTLDALQRIVDKLQEIHR